MRILLILAGVEQNPGPTDLGASHPLPFAPSPRKRARSESVSSASSFGSNPRGTLLAVRARRAPSAPLDLPDGRLEKRSGGGVVHTVDHVSGVAVRVGPGVGKGCGGERRRSGCLLFWGGREMLFRLLFSPYLPSWA